MHQILRDDPPPVEELNPEVPAELRRIIRRCLAKSADRRFHSMKDLAIELREAVEQWDRLPGSVTAAGSGASLSPAPATVPLGRKGLFWSAVVGAAVLGLGGLAFGLYAALSRAPRSPAGADPEELRTSVLMSRNDFGIETSMGGRKVSGGAVLSADGRYLAYTTLVEGRSSLNVRQVRTGSDVPILPPQPFPIRGISFSPDGDYLHYLNQDPDLPNYSALFRVPSLGGTPSKIFFDVDTAATFSPDGRQLCFRRGIVTAGQNALVIGDLATGDERELLRISRPDAFAGDPSWSPEGSRIAIGMTRLESGVRASVVTIDVATGQVAPLGSQSWTAIDSLGWAAGGEALVVSAFVFGAQGSQIYRLDWPGGESVRLTNDLNGYTNLSVAASTNQVTAIRTTDVDNIWIASLDPGAEPVALTSSTSSATSPGMVRALPDGGIAFILPQGEGTVVARMNADGSDVRAVSPRGGYVYWFDAREASGVVFGRFEAGEEGVAGIWRVNPDGSDARRLTEGYGAFAEALSPSGETLTFRRWDDAQRLRVMPTAGGEPHLLSELTGNTSAIYAPDGRRLLMTRLEPAEGGLYPRRYVVPVEGGEPTGGFLLPPGALLIAWAPDGAAVTYVDRNSGWNVYRQPIAEGEPVPLTRFEEGQVADLRWSPDGRHLALLRTIGERSALWVLEASSGSTRRVAELDHGSTRPGVAWTADSQSLVFRHGTTSQDVVMFSGF